MENKFILFIALRYFKGKRKSKKAASSILAIIGIAVGIMTLTVVIGVMNGFQLSFIEPIINIGSYHIQIKGNTELTTSEIEKIKSMPDVTAIVPFFEAQAILEGKTACLIRAIPENINSLDPAFKTSFYRKGFDIPNERTLSGLYDIVIGSQLASKINKRKGDEINLTTLNGKPFLQKKVSGIFQTWYYDIDSNWAFTSIKTADDFFLSHDDMKIVYGVKIKDRFNDTGTIIALQRLFDGKKYEIKSWREYDPGFFNALLMEKVTMMVLIGLIFIVVGFNIFHSQKRSVMEKKEEIGILKALGASPRSIRNIFLIEGFLIGFVGSFAGILLGCLLGYNINIIFRIIETTMNNVFIPGLETLLSPVVPNIRFEPVSIFSTNVFYIEKINTRILLPEVVFMSFIAISSSTFATLFASRKISEIKPKDILRYE